MVKSGSGSHIFPNTHGAGSLFGSGESVGEKRMSTGFMEFGTPLH